MNGRPSGGRFDRRRPDQGLRINNRIRVPEVRVIVDEGDQLGVMATHEALRLAEEKGLDLVEISPRAFPPVCRIMDYGKFRYEESQKAKESRKKTVQVSIKEVKFRPKIGKGDFDTKVRHMHDFLQDGHKVKVTLQFRGREMAHPELGSKILDAAIEQLGSLAKVEAYARLEGRNMTMVLAPDKRTITKKPDPKQDRPAGAADTESGPAPESAPAPEADTSVETVETIEKVETVETPEVEQVENEVEAEVDTPAADDPA
jgi:translation initiation factor IF-3